MTRNKKSLLVIWDLHKVILINKSHKFWRIFKFLVNLNGRKVQSNLIKNNKIKNQNLYKLELNRMSMICLRISRFKGTPYLLKMSKIQVH